MARVAYTSRFPQIAAQLEREVDRVVLGAAASIVMVAAASMEGQEAPSAPGHAPAIRSGILHGSMDSKMTGRHEAVAYTNVEYAQHLEYGTVHMEARPFLTPAAEQVRPNFEREVTRVVRGSGR